MLMPVASFVYIGRGTHLKENGSYSVSDRWTCATFRTHDSNSQQQVRPENINSGTVTVTKSLPVRLSDRSQPNSVWMRKRVCEGATDNKSSH